MVRLLVASSTFTAVLACSLGMSERRRQDDHVRLVGQDQALAGGRLGHDLELDGLVVGLLAPVVLVAHEHHLGALGAALVLVGAGADRLLVLGRGEVLGDVLGETML